MTLAVAILMKDPAQAKTRLRPVLGSDARERLALLMFENTLGHFMQLDAVQFVGVVTPSARIADITHEHGAETIDETGGGGINAAASKAASWALARGASSLLVIHADIPTLADAEIRKLLDAGQSRSVAIVASVDGGTNAILLTPPDAIDFHFGTGSAAAHENAARERGVDVTRLVLPFLSQDMDTPENLRSRPDLLIGGPSVAGFEAFAVPGLPEVKEGDDLGSLISDALSRAGQVLDGGDIVVVAQKVVSKAEGQMRRLDDFAPSARASEIAAHIGKDPRKVEAILSESTEVLRAEPLGNDGLMITRHHNGWICANAGIDESNLGEGMEGNLLLLPVDADRSARQMRGALQARCDLCPIGVVVTDTFGRPWRQGLVNIAIGLAGVPAIVDWAGRNDASGRMLSATMPALADEIAAAAGLLMQKDAGTPVIVVRGISWDDDPDTSARQIVRPRAQDLFQ